MRPLSHSLADSLLLNGKGDTSSFARRTLTLSWETNMQPVINLEES